MFTGLVEDIGRIERADRRSDAVHFAIRTAIPTTELALGDSVAIDGVCLTVTEKSDHSFSALAGAETLRRTTLGRKRAGESVNLERALQAGARLGGHMVQGHVDGVGKISKRRDLGANLEIGVRTPRELLRYVIEKGSIAIDGISLTVNKVDGEGFEIALIPHTVEKTSLANKRVGDEVNLEVDLIAKYVEKMTAGYQK